MKPFPSALNFIDIVIHCYVFASGSRFPANFDMEASGQNKFRSEKIMIGSRGTNGEHISIVCINTFECRFKKKTFEKIPAHSSFNSCDVAGNVKNIVAPFSEKRDIGFRYHHSNSDFPDCINAVLSVFGFEELVALQDVEH